MSDLSTKHAAFVREYLVDGNAAAAAARAGLSARSAPRLMRDPTIRAEIDRQQAGLAAETRVTVLSLVSEVEAAYRLAEAEGMPAAMIAATQLKAKLTGNLVEKTEDTVRREQMQRAMEQEGEVKTAAQLIADAAQSYGLPRTATPAQIVGAIAEKPIATPEAFRLLREVAR